MIIILSISIKMWCCFWFNILGCLIPCVRESKSKLYISSGIIISCFDKWYHSHILDSQRVFFQIYRLINISVSFLRIPQFFNYHQIFLSTQRFLSDYHSFLLPVSLKYTHLSSVIWPLPLQILFPIEIRELGSVGYLSSLQKVDTIELFSDVGSLHNNAFLNA